MSRYNQHTCEIVIHKDDEWSDRIWNVLIPTLLYFSFINLNTTLGLLWLVGLNLVCYHRTSCVAQHLGDAIAKYYPKAMAMTHIINKLCSMLETCSTWSQVSRPCHSKRRCVGRATEDKVNCTLTQSGILLHYHSSFPRRFMSEAAKTQPKGFTSSRKIRPNENKLLLHLCYKPKCYTRCFCWRCDRRGMCIPELNRPQAPYYVLGPQPSPISSLFSNYWSIGSQGGLWGGRVEHGRDKRLVFPIQ